MPDLTPLEVALINALAPDLFYFAGMAFLAIVAPYAVKVLGAQKAAILQDDFSTVLHFAIGWAVPQVAAAIRQHGWTPDIQNRTAQLAAQYIVDHRADLVAKLKPAAGHIEEAALARLASHPDVQAAVAGISPPEPTNDNGEPHASAAA